MSFDIKYRRVGDIVRECRLIPVDDSAFVTESVQPDSNVEYTREVAW